MIDQLSEEQNENLLNKLNENLDNALTNENQALRGKLCILRAYRLGAAREGARKIFVEMANSRSKDLIIEHAACIVKYGNNRHPYYINDDVVHSSRAVG